MRVLAAFGACLMLPLAGAAQQPATGGWGTQIEAPSAGSKAAPKSVPKAQDAAKETVVPRSAPDPKAPPQGEVALSALLTEDGSTIEQGIVWRAFQTTLPGVGAAGGLIKPRLVGTWREPSPVIKLPPGEYLVNASFGRAHLTRKITIAAGSSTREPFILNAGGLRLNAVLASGEAVAPNLVSYDVYAGDSDSASAGAKIISGAKPGLIVRLNAGVYQIVSTYGDANAVVRADVTVDAGKLSEATVSHQAAKVTLKLVNRPGGDALADTQWSIETTDGHIVRESMGALPSHILAPGQYSVVAKNGGRTFKRIFTVEAGDPMQVEVVIQ